LEYAHLLNDSALEALRAVLGCRVIQFFAPSVEVRQHVVISSHFSLDIRGAAPYCVVESDWDDTRSDYLDYHMMAVTLSDWPKGVGRLRPSSSEEEIRLRWPGGDALGPCSTVHPSWRWPEGVVESITVLEHRAASDEDSVHYDHALLFTCSGGYRFSLSAHKSIAGGLEFSDHEPTVRQLSEEYPERLTLRARQPLADGP
jgi:hypothetical protein